MFEDITGMVADKFSYAITHIDFYGLILPLLTYTLIIAVYGVFIWTFYRWMSKRDLFHLQIKDSRRAWLKKMLHMFKYVLFFPILIFIWFGALTTILFFLSKTQSTETILLISMAMIAAIRISSYYKEELSQEIAKILPLAVLGIFVVDPTFFSFELTISRFYQIPTLWILLANYLLFTIILEFILRAVLVVRRHFEKKYIPDVKIKKK